MVCVCVQTDFEKENDEGSDTFHKEVAKVYKTIKTIRWSVATV